MKKGIPNAGVRFPRVVRTDFPSPPSIEARLSANAAAVHLRHSTTRIHPTFTPRAGAKKTIVSLLKKLMIDDSRC